MSQAALGAKKTVETIWGKKEISIKPGMQDGARVKLKGEVILLLCRASRREYSKKETTFVW